MGEEKINDLVAHIIYEGVHDGKSEFYCAESCLIADFRLRGIQTAELYEIKLRYNAVSGRLVPRREFVGYFS